MEARTSSSITPGFQHHSPVENSSEVLDSGMELACRLNKKGLGIVVLVRNIVQVGHLIY
jgi:hypothetical protein